MAKVGCGRILIEWDHGEKREIATVDIDSDAKGTELKVTTRMRRFVFGWEFIKMGLRIMRRGWHGEETEIAEQSD